MTQSNLPEGSGRRAVPDLPSANKESQQRNLQRGLPMPYVLDVEDADLGGAYEFPLIPPKATFTMKVHVRMQGRGRPMPYLLEPDS